MTPAAKKTAVVGEVRVVADDGFAASQLFRLQRLPVGGEDELGLGLCRVQAGAHNLERSPTLPVFTQSDMDVVALKHGTGHIRSVVVACAQTLKGGVLLPATRNANENSAASKGSMAKLEIAASFSTAFMWHCLSEFTLSHLTEVWQLTRPARGLLSRGL